MKFFDSIKFRLNLSYVLFLLLAMLFLTTISYVMLDRSLFLRTEQPFAIKSIQLNYTTEVARGRPASGEYEILAIISYSEEQLRTIQGSDTYPVSILTPAGELTLNLKEFIQPETRGGLEIWTYGRFSPTSSGVYDIMIATESKANAANVMGTYRRVLFVSIPLTFILAGIIGFVWVRRVLRPVDQMVNIARGLEENDLKRRIEIRTNDELGNLGVAFNQAFGRLQESFEREHRFMADASHELRAPLAVMQSEADIALNAERTTEEYQESLETIAQDTARMTAIIQKLLMLSRAESGKEQLNLTQVDIKGLLTDVIEDMQILGETKSIHISSDLQDDLAVEGDETKLRELFVNLLDNAIKYTPAGGTITVSLIKKDQIAHITIKDTGIGIAEEHLQHVFERFYRVDQAHSLHDNGSGLGLAICKQIVEMHKGKITVESKVGKGSMFAVTLPLARD